MLLALSASAAACSTPISPYSPIEDDDEEETPDSGVGGTVRDAGSPGRSDAGTTSPTAGSNNECARVPVTGGVFGSLFDDGCASRRAESCATRTGQVVQQLVNQWLTDIVSKCGVSATTSLGVTFNRSGCPNFYAYNDPTLRNGAAATCVENELNNRRLACTPGCALAGPISR